MRRLIEQFYGIRICSAHMFWASGLRQVRFQRVGQTGRAHPGSARRSLWFRGLQIGAVRLNFQSFRAERGDRDLSAAQFRQHGRGDPEYGTHFSTPSSKPHPYGCLQSRAERRRQAGLDAPQQRYQLSPSVWQRSCAQERSRSRSTARCRFLLANQCG